MGCAFRKTKCQWKKDLKIEPGFKLETFYIRLCKFYIRFHKNWAGQVNKVVQYNNTLLNVNPSFHSESVGYSKKKFKKEVHKKFKICKYYRKFLHASLLALISRK